MCRKSWLAVLVFTIMLALTVPVLADENTSNTDTGKTDTADKDKKQLEKLQAELKKLLDMKAQLESKIQDEITKAKAHRDKRDRESEEREDKARTAGEKLDESLNKMIAREKDEQERLKAEIAKWTDSISKHRAALQARLNEIDADLQKQLQALDKRISEAKTDEEKQKLQAAREAKQKYADMRKGAVNKYITDLDAFWADKQKLWNAMLELLIRRQSIEADFRTAMANINKNEIQDSLANMAVEQSKTDDAIEKKVSDRYQKKLDELKARIEKIKSQIAGLTK